MSILLGLVISVVFLLNPSVNSCKLGTGDACSQCDSKAIHHYDPAEFNILPGLNVDYNFTTDPSSGCMILLISCDAPDDAYYFELRLNNSTKLKRINGTHYRNTATCVEGNWHNEDYPVGGGPLTGVECGYLR